MSHPLFNGGVIGATDDQRRPYIADDGNWSLQGAKPGEGPTHRSIFLLVNTVPVFGFYPTWRSEPWEQAAAREGCKTREEALAWRGPPLNPGDMWEIRLKGGVRYEGWGDSLGKDEMEWGSGNPTDLTAPDLVATTGLLVVPGGPPPQPLPKPPPEGTLIGSQHGITAMCNNWRSVWPNWTNPSRDPNDLGTWKAIDKLERTLLILAADHDAGLQ